jgi:hypothetical protein
VVFLPHIERIAWRADNTAHAHVLDKIRQVIVVDQPLQAAPGLTGTLRLAWI